MSAIKKSTSPHKSFKKTELSEEQHILLPSLPKLNNKKHLSIRNPDSSTMPVTVWPSTHSSSPISPRLKCTTSPLDHLKGACRKESEQCRALLQSSFSTTQAETNATYPSENGFIRAAIQAYSQHHHLTIRPDDVWLSIVSQLSLFINAHAEELRAKFVAHQGKKELEVIFERGNRHTIDWGTFAKTICDLIEENVVDAELREWMIPAFSTTEEKDKIVASVLMMGSMQKYFDYLCTIRCGLASVTLLGEKKDWELILARLGKLSSIGEEPALFERLLKPVVQRFIRSFDEPAGKEVLEFWGQIAHYLSGGSGPSYYSGWITAFCLWDHEGKSMYRKPPQMRSWGYDDDPDLDGLTPAGTGRRTAEGNAWKEKKHLTLGDVDYHWVESNEVPPGYTSVPVKVDDNGDKFEAMMVAGSVGIKASASNHGGSGMLDTIGAETGWWIFEKEEVLVK